MTAAFLLQTARGSKCLRKKSTIFSMRRCLTMAYNTLHEGSIDQIPIILMHGLLGNKNNFNYVGKLLGKETNSTIISCDARNHGDSLHSDEMNYPVMSQDVLDLADSLDIEHFAILGHSMGGRIAMYTALSEPSRVKKLVVVDISPGHQQEEHGIAQGAVKYMKAMRQVKWQPGIKRSAARKEASKQLEADIPEQGIRNFVLTNLIETSPGKYGWKVNLDAILNHSHNLYFLPDGGKFPPYMGKTLFLGGSLSDYIRPEDIPSIKNLFPNAIIKNVPEAGHWVHADKPNEFVTAVAEFINNS